MPPSPPSSLPQQRGKAAATQGRPYSDGDMRNSMVIQWFPPDSASVHEEIREELVETSASGMELYPRSIHRMAYLPVVYWTSPSLLLWHQGNKMVFTLLSPKIWLNSPSCCWANSASTFNCCKQSLQFVTMHCKSHIKETNALQPFHEHHHPFWPWGFLETVHDTGTWQRTPWGTVAVQSVFPHLAQNPLLFLNDSVALPLYLF